MQRTRTAAAFSAATRCKSIGLKLSYLSIRPFCCCHYYHFCCHHHRHCVVSTILIIDQIIVFEHNNFSISSSYLSIIILHLIIVLEHSALKVGDSCLLSLQESFKLEVRLPSVQKYNLMMKIMMIIMMIVIFSPHN